MKSTSPDPVRLRPIGIDVAIRGVREVHPQAIDSWSGRVWTSWHGFERSASCAPKMPHETEYFLGEDWIDAYSKLPAKPAPESEKSPLIQMSEFCIAVDEGGMDDPRVREAVALARKGMDEADAEVAGWSQGKREGADVSLRRNRPKAAPESEDEAFERFFRERYPIYAVILSSKRHRFGVGPELAEEIKQVAHQSWNARARMDA